MGGLLASLAKWCRLPERGGFAELDKQIEKLRLLRDAYQPPFQEQRHEQTAGVKKGGEQLDPLLHATAV